MKPRFTIRKPGPAPVQARPATVDAWEEGARSAREGQAPDSNPHAPDLYEFVTWLHGWAHARHTLAKEQR